MAACFLPVAGKSTLEPCATVTITVANSNLNSPAIASPAHPIACDAVASCTLTHVSNACVAETVFLSAYPISLR